MLADKEPLETIDAEFTITSDTVIESALPAYETMTLDQIAVDINKRVDRMSTDIIAVGTALLEARERFPGDREFGKWREANLKVSQQTAHRFMTVAKSPFVTNGHIEPRPPSEGGHIEPRALCYLLNHGIVEDRAIAFNEAESGNLVDINKAHEIVAARKAVEKQRAALAKVPESIRPLVEERLENPVYTVNRATEELKPLITREVKDRDVRKDLELVARDRDWSPEVIDIAVKVVNDKNTPPEYVEELREGNIDPKVFDEHGVGTTPDAVLKYKDARYTATDYAGKLIRNSVFVTGICLNSIDEIVASTNADTDELEDLIQCAVRMTGVWKSLAENLKAEYEKMK